MGGLGLGFRGCCRFVRMFLRACCWIRNVQLDYRNRIDTKIRGTGYDG